MLNEEEEEEEEEEPLNIEYVEVMKIGQQSLNTPCSDEYSLLRCCLCCKRKTYCRILKQAMKKRTLLRRVVSFEQLVRSSQQVTTFARPTGHRALQQTAKRKAHSLHSSAPGNKKGRGIYAATTKCELP